MNRLAVAALLFMSACATSERPTTKPTTAAPANEAVTDAARRVYWLAEEQFARGNYTLAVQLWRHALLQLPKTKSADAVRHALVLRMAYGQLAAAESSEANEPARDGVVMLERYIERHEALFGDTNEARQERGEVYELLYELEQRAEQSAVPDAEPQDHAVEDPPLLEPSTSANEDEPQPTAYAIADSSGEEAEYVRHLRVRHRHEDPQVVRERLESDFSDASTGLVFGAYGVVPLHGPRPLLRIRTARWSDGSRRSESARASVRTLADQAREPLLACYLDAITRNTNKPTSVSVRLESKSSHMSVAIVDGGLLDGWGDVCLAEAFSAVDAPPGLELDAELVFFVQGALMIREWNGRAIRDELELIADVLAEDGPPKREGGLGLPPIDQFGGSS